MNTGTDYLENSRRFSLVYGGRAMDECSVAVTSRREGGALVTEYLFEDGLKVTNTAVKNEQFGAWEWYNRLENVSDSPTQLISELYDADFTLPIAHEDTRRWKSFFPDEHEATKVIAPSGSTWSCDEFYCDPDRIVENKRINHIYPGVTKEYSTKGGRSSVTHAPFFDVTKKDAGFIFAVGWTGQWRCSVTRGEDDVNVKFGIEDVSFRLLPGESVRTCSAVVMPYACANVEAHNRWRRLLRTCYSLAGKPGRDAQGPLCACIWGGMKSSAVLERIETIRKNALPIEYVWMDAGWYGDTEPTPDEFEGDWAQHTGDWQVSEKTHPGGLVDVARAIHDAGMKFVLWFEPERVKKNLPVVSEHPEYFLSHPDPQNSNLLLNLGNEAAWSYCFETVAGLIEKIGVDFYRQDFNFEPLPYWRANDAEDRQGITEIKHISGMYRFWDALLERFPHLMIDNCASGGRRIDIETLRRSIPLWRSDYTCPANFDDYAVQCHSQTYNSWVPYSGTSTGRLYDLYRIRSSYGASLAVSHPFSEREDFCDTPGKAALLKKTAEEYLRIRPFFTEDFYPLTDYSDKTDVWCAAQFDRPDGGDGVIRIFRREDSPYTHASFMLGNIDPDAVYTFTDADGGAPFTRDGRTLADSGFEIGIPEPRSAKIFFYTVTRP